MSLVICLFIVAFIWQLFLTYGFDFFWEDLDIFHIYRTESAQFRNFKQQYCPNTENPTKFSVILGIFKGYGKEFFVTNRLFQIGFDAYSFNDRPYQFLTWDLLKVTLGKKVILYRIFKVIIFAINSCLIFLIINRISRLLALLATVLFITSSEIWLSTLYISCLGLIPQGTTILSVFLFIKLLEKSPLRHRDLWLYYLLILFISNFGILYNADGRYLAIIFFLTILFFRRKELLFHLFPLIVLFLMQFPFLGYVKKIFSHDSFSPINFASHVSSSPSTFSTIYSSISNYKFPQHAIGNQLLIILTIAVLIHLFSILLRYLYSLFRRDTAKINASEVINNFVKERLILFILWFICAFALVAKARNFRYGYPYYEHQYNLQLFDLAYFIAAFIIFFSYYVAFIKTKFSKKFYNYIFISICISLVIVQIYSNFIRLGKFREEWSDYFYVWTNTKEYVDGNSDNALVLAFTQMHYKPFVFNSNNKLLNTKDPCEQSEFCDLTFVESRLKNGFKDVFVAARGELNFRGDSESVILKQIKTIDGSRKDLYGRLFNRPSKSSIYLYHFKLKNGQTSKLAYSKYNKH